MVLGGQNERENLCLRRVILMFVSRACLHRFLLDFWRLKTLKIAIFLKENNDFYKIGVFKKDPPKARF